MRASIVLKPSESKRLIAKAIAQKEEVKKAMENAYIILAEGSINFMVAEELFGLKIDPSDFICGMVVDGVLCSSGLCSLDPRFKFKAGFVDSTTPEISVTVPLVAYKGKVIDMKYEDAINDFHLDTVIIKGGNAVDREGNVGVIIAGYDGGFISKVFGHTVSQGVKLITPIGLEKSVFSVPEAAKYTGGKRFDYSMGEDYGLFVITTADVVTEIEALKLLTGADSYHVASGGIGGSEGAVVISCEGNAESIDRVIKVIESVKGEPPIQKGRRQQCDSCRYVNCNYYRKEKDKLPKWMM